MRKKLFAILMSAMMMVTFMPAMAFADTNTAEYRIKDNTVAFAEDYQSASLKIETRASGTAEWVDYQTVTTTDIAYDFLQNATDKTVGTVEATATWNLGKDVEGLDGKPLSTGKFTNTANYYDLTGAVVNLKASVSNWDYVEIDANGYVTNPSIASITLKQPAYDTTGVTGQKKTLSASSELVKALVITAPEYKKYAEGKYAFTVKVKTDAKGKALKAGDFAVLGETSFEQSFLNQQTFKNAEVSVAGATVATKAGYKAVEAKALADHDLLRFKATYDAQEHAVAVEEMENVKAEYAVDTYDATKKTWTEGEYSETAPVVKNAGKYYFRVKLTSTATNPLVKTPREVKVVVEVEKRNVSVVAAQLVKEKNYDGKGFALTDEDFIITGLATGDKLVVVPFETKADVGTYAIGATQLNALFNTNYKVNLGGLTSLSLGKINKADNQAKIVNNTMTIKAGKSKAVKFSSMFGTPVLKKVSGTTKIQLKNGKLVVKKGTKKGTYKIKLKAYTPGTANYASASRIKTIKVKVK